MSTLVLFGVGGGGPLCRLASTRARTPRRGYNFTYEVREPESLERVTLLQVYRGTDPAADQVRGRASGLVQARRQTTGGRVCPASLHLASRSDTSWPSCIVRDAHAFASRQLTGHCELGSRRRGMAGAQPLSSSSRQPSSHGTGAGFDCFGVEEPRAQRSESVDTKSTITDNKRRGEERSLNAYRRRGRMSSPMP
jgi:hypothetical protein